MYSKRHPFSHMATAAAAGHLAGAETSGRRIGRHRAAWTSDFWDADSCEIQWSSASYHIISYHIMYIYIYISI